MHVTLTNGDNAKILRECDGPFPHGERCWEVVVIFAVKGSHRKVGDWLVKRETRIAQFY